MRTMVRSIWGVVSATGLVFVVDTLEDEPDARLGNLRAETAGGATTLRAALEELAFLNTEGEMRFDPTLFSGGPQTITIDESLGDFFVKSRVTLAGPGAAWLTISGGGQRRIFQVIDGGFDISDVTLADGLARGGNGGNGEGEGSLDDAHTADQDRDFEISLSELLRIVQFYNSQGLYCADNLGDTEDGYIPGVGVNRLCTPHDADYNTQDWQIRLTEVLRIIQLYNAVGYRYCPTESTEDGYCPGS